jgi:hypothetical protein
MMKYLVLILTLVLAASCGHDSEDSAEGAVLNIYVYPADDPMVTRGDAGLVNAYAQEDTIKSLKIWVFKHGNAANTDKPLHYLSPSEPVLQGGRAQLFQIALTDEQVKAITGDGNQVDVYVLANAESIGQGSLNGTSTRTAVRDAVIGTGYFGTTILTTDISTNGLPMSGCGENISVRGTLPVLSLPVVKLTRCVSKLRIVLAQNKESGAEFSILGVTLNGNQFPETENVFNRTTNPYSISGFYMADEIHFSLPDTIAKNDRITDLVYESQQVQDYEDIVDAFVERGDVTQMGPYYFRESDKRLRGTISYRVVDEEKNVTENTVNFSMSDIVGNYNFSRNHTWLVYAYYLGGEELQLSLAYIRSWSEEDREPGIYNW